MRNEEVREVLLTLQLIQQIDDLRLNGNIERRDRLIGDDEIGIDSERARNTDAAAVRPRTRADNA